MASRYALKDNKIFFDGRDVSNDPEFLEQIIEIMNCFTHEPEEIPDYGDVLDMEDFIARCEDGSFIDYDGFGHPVIGGKMDPAIEIRPSHIMKGKYKQYNKIVWFNR